LRELTVPSDLLGSHLLVADEVLIDGVGSRTVDVDLAEHGESHAVLACDLEKRKEKRKSQWMSLRWPPGLSPRPSSRGSSATTVEEGEEKESLEGYLRTP